MDTWNFAITYHLTPESKRTRFIASIPAVSRDTALMAVGAMLYSQHPTAIVDAIHSQIGE